MWADTGYNGKRLARYAQSVAAITVEVVARTSPHSFRVLRRRWVVERTHSWMNRFRRVLVRWEKKVENYFGMLHFVCAWITYRSAGLLG